MSENESKPRRGVLTFTQIETDEFLKFVRQNGRSEEVGPIGSQFEEELKKGHKNVGTFGLVACGSLVGGVSYGLQVPPKDPQKMLGRLDVVTSSAKLRGKGLGALLIAGLFDWFIQTYGEKLMGISTIAAHPAVVHCVLEYGFAAPPDNMTTPRYMIQFDDPELLKTFSKAVKHQMVSRLQTLRLNCIHCQKWNWSTPWCRESEKKSA